jgi:hypothetical protein
VEAGFKDIGVTTPKINLDLPRPEEFIRLRLSATPVAGVFATPPQPVQGAIVQQVLQQLAPFADGAGFRTPFCSRVVGAPR